MTYQHKNLADERWVKMSLMEQMANIGSEIFRATSWKKKNKPEYCIKALDRGLELLDLTIKNTKNSQLKELTRLREVICDFFLGDNYFNTDAEMINKYFYHFAAGLKR